MKKQNKRFQITEAAGDIEPKMADTSIFMVPIIDCWPVLKRLTPSTSLDSILQICGAAVATHTKEKSIHIITVIHSKRSGNLLNSCRSLPHSSQILNSLSRHWMQDLVGWHISSSIPCA